jgi:hypothetical protein
MINLKSYTPSNKPVGRVASGDTGRSLGRDTAWTIPKEGAIPAMRP